jgi:hypothetical protein
MIIPPGSRGSHPSFARCKNDLLSDVSAGESSYARGNCIEEAFIMKKYQRYALLLVLLLSAAVTSCSNKSDEDTSGPEETIRAVAQAFSDGYDSRSLDEFDGYFAPADKADQAGIGNTKDLAHQLFAEAEPGTKVEITDLTITNQNVDTQRDEAVVTYQAQVAFLQGDQTVSALLVTQNVALKKIDGRWLISGGDQPQTEPGQG